MLLKQLLEKTGVVKIIGECEDAIAANHFLQNKHVDILFLDIEMPGMNGLELLRMLQEKPLTILTTARQVYAVEAFELNVVDYLVKPFSLSRVLIAVDRARELLTHKNVQLGQEPSNEVLFIKDNKSIRRLDINDIQYIEARGDYIRIYTKANNFIVHCSLKMIEDKFPSGKFLRVHRSYIIAINKINYIEDKAAYIGEVAIPISESYKDALLKNLNLL